MSENVRRQLTLFLSEEYSRSIELVRQQFNPIQYELIPSHVTLCYEDEIEDFPPILKNLTSLKEGCITIDFDEVKRFSNDEGVLISASQPHQEYDVLREKILTGVGPKTRNPAPHITLMHPRNSTCTDEIFEELKKLKFALAMKFDQISLIEQVNNGKWKILENFNM